MQPDRAVSDQCDRPAGNAPDITLADTFQALWDELRVTIGSAPTAALLRRAVVISRDCCPILSGVSIEKSGRDYAYRIPEDAGAGGDTQEQLARFVTNAVHLLAELTGNVLVAHLQTNPTICILMTLGSSSE